MKRILLAMALCLLLLGCTADPADRDGKFSIAILPDTQQEVVITEAIKNRHFANRNEWLVSIQEERDLRFVLHTGDVVNWGDADETQLKIASEAMAVLDEAGIPTVLALGNHDTAAVGVGGSAAVPSETRLRVRDTSAFWKYFNDERYPYLTLKDPEHIENAYALFEAGGVKWLVLALELWPRTNVIEWANQVVSDHPQHNVIVITHSFLNAMGGIGQSNGGYGANSPKYLLDNLILKHENIRLVFSGHEGFTTFREDVGEHGNKIVSVLGCFHSNTGNPVRLMEIDVKNGSITSEVYNPLTETENGTFCFTIEEMDFIGG